MSATEPRSPGPGDGLAAEAAAVVREKTDIVPEVAVILGSGLREAATALEDEAAWTFGDLPGFVPPAVPGHDGRLAIGTFHGVATAMFVGRIHFYEGHPMSTVTLPVRLAHALGAHTLVATASVGGLDPSLPVGTIAVGVDHINLMGENPLRGWRRADGTPTFVNAFGLYDGELARLALDEGRGLGLTTGEAVYLAVAGPSYETPAEIRFMREAGGTVVGMSMVPDVLAARALDMRVLGLFAITNAGDDGVSHDEVVTAGGALGGTLGRLLERVVPKLSR